MLLQGVLCYAPFWQEKYSFLFEQPTDRVFAAPSGIYVTSVMYWTFSVIPFSMIWPKGLRRSFITNMGKQSKGISINFTFSGFYI